MGEVRRDDGEGKNEGNAMQRPFRLVLVSRLAYLGRVAESRRCSRVPRASAGLVERDADISQWLLPALTIPSI